VQAFWQEVLKAPQVSEGYKLEKQNLAKQNSVFVTSLIVT